MNPLAALASVGNLKAPRRWPAAFKKGTPIMAEIFRPVYHVDPATGKRVNAGAPGAVRKKSSTWWIRYYTPDGERHKVKGYPDKKATEAKAAGWNAVASALMRV